MNKTIKQMADELGIDKQKVYRYIKKNHIDEVHREVHHKKSVKYYNEAVQKQIKLAFLENEVHQEHIKTTSKPHQKHIDEAVVDVLKEQLKTMQKNLDVLHEELKEKNKHIKELTTVIDKHADSVHVDRQKLLAETIVDGQQKFIEDKKRRWMFWK